MSYIKNYTNLSKILFIYNQQVFNSNIYLKKQKKFILLELNKYQSYRYKEYLTKKSLYTQILLNLNLISFFNYKMYCLYTLRNRAVYSKYRMSRHYLKYCLENFKMIY